ncbi:unnamed protein product [Haemonchus placei]|uniref:Uncharacterized protein n=1 Tax=Haemonchus placei TaxID=6290 RepID=A0A3P7ZIU4_HAEPC|nr:unnamed protein product [Haemonchus placei]
MSSPVTRFRRAQAEILLFSTAKLLVQALHFSVLFFATAASALEAL